MNIKFSHREQKFIFLLVVTAIYSALFVWFDFLRAPPVQDEVNFWKASLTFSDQIIPSIDDLRNYGELNTPLPFIIFGVLEYLFHQGIAAGRLLNIILSISIIFIVGWPSRDKGGRAILSLIGLLLCPNFWRYGILMYTDTIASFFVLLGFISYIRNRHFLSSIAFILAIASRQYMLAFPMAIATYEFLKVVKNIKSIREINLAQQWRWIAPLIAALSIFGWIYLFGGLAPQTAISNRAPDVQKTTWALTAGGAINFLGFVGFYIVIPEFILFQPRIILETLKQRRKVIAIAIILLICFFIFPPFLNGLGIFMKVLNLLSFDNLLRIFLFYCLSLLACIRFSKLNLMSLNIIFNSLIMMKAYPWDKYILPLVIIFWYLKSSDEKHLI